MTWTAFQPGRSWRTLSRSLLQLSELGLVADFGVGSGELTLLLARAAEGMYAVDVDEGRLALLEKKAALLGVPNIDPLVGDFETVELPEPVHLNLAQAQALGLGEYAEARITLQAYLDLEPTGRWIEQTRVALSKLPEPPKPVADEAES